MQKLNHIPPNNCRAIRFVLTDIDDTLTTNGRLPACAFAAMEHLQQADFAVIPITGRPAGWCDHIARMWPVAGVVGENGAFYFHYDDDMRRMRRRFFKSADQRQKDRERLAKLLTDILSAVTGAAVSADQGYREADLAIDFCEDVQPLPPEQIARIVALFQQAGAQAKVSSIHVNGWFGNYDKLSMSRLFFEEVLSLDLEKIKDQVIYIGDSPNDEPMFAFFPNAVGVANIKNFENTLKHPPTWITTQAGGQGFAEMAGILLNFRTRR
jgi:HAD superfamily hydrolase (TIGR01484 family)